MHEKYETKSCDTCEYKVTYLGVSGCAYRCFINNEDVIDELDKRGWCDNYSPIPNL